MNGPLGRALSSWRCYVLDISTKFSLQFSQLIDVSCCGIIIVLGFFHTPRPCLVPHNQLAPKNCKILFSFNLGCRFGYRHSGKNSLDNQHLCPKSPQVVHYVCKQGCQVCGVKFVQVLPSRYVTN